MTEPILLRLALNIGMGGREEVIALMWNFICELLLPKEGFSTFT